MICQHNEFFILFKNHFLFNQLLARLVGRGRKFVREGLGWKRTWKTSSFSLSHVLFPYVFDPEWRFSLEQKWFCFNETIHYYISTTNFFKPIYIYYISHYILILSFSKIDYKIFFEHIYTNVLFPTKSINHSFWKLTSPSSVFGQYLIWTWNHPSFFSFFSFFIFPSLVSSLRFFLFFRPSLLIFFILKIFLPFLNLRSKQGKEIFLLSSPLPRLVG